jgi:hypothetical protein
LPEIDTEGDHQMHGADSASSEDDPAITVGIAPVLYFNVCKVLAAHGIKQAVEAAKVRGITYSAPIQEDAARTLELQQKEAQLLLNINGGGDEDCIALLRKKIAALQPRPQEDPSEAKTLGIAADLAHALSSHQSQMDKTQATFESARLAITLQQEELDIQLANLEQINQLERTRDAELTAAIKAVALRHQAPEMAPVGQPAGQPMEPPVGDVTVLLSLAM